jgi:hypothetical protein
LALLLLLLLLLLVLVAPLWLMLRVGPCCCHAAAHWRWGGALGWLFCAFCWLVLLVLQQRCC